MKKLRGDQWIKLPAGASHVKIGRTGEVQVNVPTNMSARTRVTKKNPRRRKAAKMVTVLGHRVRKGTKRHQILLWQKNHSDDLLRAETGRGRSNPKRRKAAKRLTGSRTNPKRRKNAATNSTYNAGYRLGQRDARSGKVKRGAQLMAYARRMLRANNSAGNMASYRMGYQDGYDGQPQAKANPKRRKNKTVWSRPPILKRRKPGSRTNPKDREGIMLKRAGARINLVSESSGSVVAYLKDGARAIVYDPLADTREMMGYVNFRQVVKQLGLTPAKIRAIDKAGRRRKP